MKVMVVGTFDVDNYGDCIFPDVLACQLSKRFPSTKIEFDLYSPHAEVARIGTYSVVKELPGKQGEVATLPRYDVAILAGGEVLQSGHHPKSMYCRIAPGTMSAGMRLWMVPALVGIQQSIPCVYNGVGVGNIEQEAVEGLREVVSLSGFATLRDENSLSKLRKVDAGFDMPIGTDSVFTIKDLYTDDEWQASAREVLPAGVELDQYLVVQPRLDYTNSDFSSWAEQIYKIASELDVPVLLLPICYHHSDHLAIPAISNVLMQLGLEVFSISQFIKTNQTAAVLSQSAGYVGTSLHGTITSVAFAKPIAILAKLNGKYDGVLRNIGVEGVVTEKISGMYESFCISRDMDRIEISDRAYAMASTAFDEIGRVISAPPALRVNDALVSQSVLNSIEYDVTHYSRRKLDVFIRRLFILIRGNGALYGLYEKVSSFKNRRRKGYELN